jgi:hypothetical protein
MVVILIKITIEDRLKWIEKLLLNLEMIFMFLYSVRLHNVSLFYCLNIALDAPCLPTPFNAALDTWCLLPPFNALDAWCLLPNASCLPSMLFMNASRLPFTLILKLSSDCLLPIPLPFLVPVLNSHALVLFYCFIHFDFLSIVASNFPFYHASLTRNR